MAKQSSRWYGMPNTSEPRYGLLAAISYACLICKRPDSQIKGVDYWTRFHKVIYDAGLRSETIADFPAYLAMAISADLSRVIVKGLAIPLDDDPSVPRIGIFSREEIIETTDLQALAPAYWLHLVEDCCSLHRYASEDVLEIARDIYKSQWLVVACRLRKLEDDQIKADKLAELERTIEEVSVLEVV